MDEGHRSLAGGPHGRTAWWLEVRKLRVSDVSRCHSPLPVLQSPERLLTLEPRSRGLLWERSSDTWKEGEGIWADRVFLSRRLG